MIVHCWSVVSPKDADEERRHRVARETWQQAKWSSKPIIDDDLPRLFNEGVKKLPHIRDLFDLGNQDLDDMDVLVFTNADTCVAKNICWRITEALVNNHATYAFRRDFYHPIKEPLRDDEIQAGKDYPGSDLFAFRVGWWKRWRDLYPDLILAREAWDCCLRVLMERTNETKPVSMPNAIYHERHDNGWEANYVRYTLAGQRHNLRLAYSWLRSQGYDPMREFGVRLP